MLEIKSAHRQTSIFTLWDSGRVYQYQQILEHQDATTAARYNSSEKATAKKVTASKVTTPACIWIYLGMGVFVMVVYWVYRKV